MAQFETVIIRGFKIIFIWLTLEFIYIFAANSVNRSITFNINKVKRDENGEYTYIGPRGETVIDYGIINEEAWEEIRSFKIGERTQSDHQPLETEIVLENISKS